MHILPHLVPFTDLWYMQGDCFLHFIDSELFIRMGERNPPPMNAHCLHPPMLSAAPRGYRYAVLSTRESLHRNFWKKNINTKTMVTFKGIPCSKGLKKEWL